MLITILVEIYEYCLKLTGQVPCTWHLNLLRIILRILIKIFILTNLTLHQSSGEYS